MSIDLTTPVQYVKGIGPRLAEVLAAKGISVVEDLLYYLPFRYEDRLNPRTIPELMPGEMATVIAEVRTSGLFRTRNRGLQIFEMTAGQGRHTLKSTWFHAPYLKDKFQPGQLVALYGKVDQSTKGRGALVMTQPQFEILGMAEDGASPEEMQSLEMGRIVPIYEASGKLSSRWFRKVIHGALSNLSDDLPDAIPAIVRGHMQLMPRQQAFWHAHWPDEGESFPLLQSSRTPAHQRLIFEELYFLELGLELKRRRMRQQPGIAFQVTDPIRQAVKRILPFHPTAAQKRVMKEIASEMQQPTPMRRLLQGDVGSGKTIIAFQSAIIAIENGYQVAIMAPTEILATQHFLSARRILERAGYRIVLLTGSLEADRKRDTRRHIASGDAQLVIGTHALLEEGVEFAKLGLVIVDEQHRFGVMQRLKLMRKTTQVPDTVVMTATPIPRTLALTIYGDLDVSTIDELPPGRTPIVTRRVPDDRSDEVWTFAKKVIAAGNQVYIVYPVIEEAEAEQAPADSPADSKPPGTGRQQLKAAMQMYDQLRTGPFAKARVGLLHGRMDAAEKEIAMSRFQRGELNVLVSTTVIEVGVDVPNASLMIIEHAERFGLSQLHQLRGRIGRGSAKSYCILMTGPKITPEAEQRLDTMVATTDGFQIAEKDLELRGPGEFFGTRQAGMPSLRVANIIRDRDLLEAAKKEARYTLAAPEHEVSPEERNRALKYLQSHWNRRYGLVEVG